MQCRASNKSSFEKEVAEAGGAVKVLAEQLAAVEAELVARVKHGTPYLVADNDADYQGRWERFGQALKRYWSDVWNRADVIRSALIASRSAALRAHPDPPGARGLGSRR